jgi:tetratricopeptide (TPR) repeat protein
VAPLEDQRLAVLGARIDADLRLGRPAELAGELRQLVAAHPLREDFHAQLMLALYRGGRQGDALAAYQHARRVLADELGVDPGPALQRMHQRILAADPGLLPTDSTGPAPGTAAFNGTEAPERVVPRQLPGATRHFAGRAEAVKTLAGLAAEAGGESRAVVIAAIEGTAGVGKTTLAVHFAHQVADRFPDGQLYVNLRGFDPAVPPMAPGEAVRIFLEALGVPAAQIPASLDAQAGLYRSLLAGRRMLVLLDNAADAGQVRPLLPAGPGCLVLVTSRSQLTGLVAAEGAYPQILDVLTDADARELLARRLGPERLSADPAAAGELIELCARRPLALAIAAARAAAQPHLPLASLAADLREAGGRLDALDAGRGAANVRAVFSWSYQQLDVIEARLFRLLGLHPGPDIGAPAAASMAGLPPRPARAALAELARVHLLTEQTPGRYSFHDLLRAYAAERARADDSEAEQRAATHRMLDHYLHTAYPAAMMVHPSRRPVTPPALDSGAEPEQLPDKARAMAWFEAERRVLMGVVAQAPQAGFDAYAWYVSWPLARFLELRGPWHEWVIVERTALAATQRLGDRAAQAFAHWQLGYANARLGNYQASRAQLQQALGIYQELGDRVGQADVHHTLAIMVQFQSQYAEALDHSRQALELFAAAGDRTGQAIALNAVGWFHAMLGDHRQALAYCGQTLKLHQTLGYPKLEAATLDSLGYAHHHLGDHAESIACYQRALELYREVGDRWGQAETLGHTGDVHHAAGHRQQARQAWEEALAILEDLQHADADQIRAKLAGLGADPGT